MKRLETSIALGLATIFSATFMLLATALPPHGEASASGYGVAAPLVASR